MTIYLFIDLPFNEIGCYPTSPRDGGRKKRQKIRKGGVGLGEKVEQRGY